MLLHELSNLWVSLDLPSGFRGLSPGVVSQDFPLSSFPRVSSVCGRVTSLLVADEALSVPDVLHSFVWRKVDLVYVHSVGVRSRGSAGRRDIAISSSLEFPELYHISVELSCFVKPLFPFPTSLPIRVGSGGHHDRELLSYSPLKSVYQDAVIIDPATRLG